MNIKEFLQNLSDFKFEVEVYKEISVFLSEFLRTDNRSEPKKAIEVDGQFVPDYILEKVLEVIVEKIDDLEKEIHKCESKTI